MKLPSSALLLLLPALALNAAEAPSRTETRQESLAMGSKLWIMQHDGKVDVQGWDKPEVSIVAEFRDGSHGSKATLEVRKVAQGLEIEVKVPHQHHLPFFSLTKSPICNLTLMVPRKLCMAARAVDGEITVKNLQGYADLHSVDGNVKVSDIEGEVHAHSVDGNIQATHLNARIKGGTVDGNITLDQVSGGLELKTVDGKITANDLDGWGEGITLSTVDGSIHVKLGQAKGALLAKSMDGRIRIDNPALVLEETRKNTVRGHIPGRKQNIDLKTVDGDIQID